MEYGFKERFQGVTGEELVAILNSEASNSGWGTARGFFLSALREAFLESGLDCSSFITEGRMRLIRVKLEGNKVVPIASSKPAQSEPRAMLGYDDVDDQSLIDDLIRALGEGNTEMARELGPEIAARELGDLVDNEIGILRPFDELDDTELAASLLSLSPERLEQIESGDRFTEEEVAALEDAVREQCFQADGTNKGWSVLSIGNSTGNEAFVAVTVSGGSIEGVERDFVGAFSSLLEAKAALKKFGYLNAEDFSQRSRSTRI